MTKKNMHQYTVIVEHDEDKFFVASVPALPGCHTQAKTMAELKKRIADAIRLCLDVAQTNASYRKRLKQFAYAY